MDFAMAQPHIMDPSMGRLLSTLHSLLARGIATAIDYNESNAAFPMSDSHAEMFAGKWLLYSLVWAFGGSMTMDKRSALGDLLLAHSTFSADVPTGTRLVDLSVEVSDGSWREWAAQVPRVEIESHKVTLTLTLTVTLTLT